MSNQYKNIIVAVDGSKEAEYAFRKAIDVAKRNVGSKLNIINVIDSRPFVAEHYLVERAQQESEVLLNGYKEQAEAEGLENVQAVIKFGSAKNVISREYADSVEADLIICGAKGLNAVERILLGSVSEAIVRYASCDVLVVRTPE